MQHSKYVVYCASSRYPSIWNMAQLLLDMAQAGSAQRYLSKEWRYRFNVSKIWTSALSLYTLLRIGRSYTQSRTMLTCFMLEMGYHPLPRQVLRRETYRKTFTALLSEKCECPHYLQFEYSFWKLLEIESTFSPIIRYVTLR